MILEQLAKNSLFDNVSQEYLQTMVSNRVEVNLDPGDFLFHQGDMGKGMYIVVEGTIDVVLQTSLHQVLKVVATLKEGDYVGEVCMINPQPRTAGVRAKEKAKLLYIDANRFTNDIKDKDPNALQIGYNIALTLSERLKQANSMMASLSMEQPIGTS
jgi:CRP-like cAMP-binding protein